VPDASLIDPSMQLRPPDPAPAACKICGGVARLFGVTDFNRSCDDLRIGVLPLSGHPVYYRRCEGCGLLFTDAMDDWTHADFGTHIYNDAYIQVDPDYDVVRPANGAAVIANTFGSSADLLNVLDYGGGSGHLANQLRSAGFPRATAYDPFHPDHRQRPEGRFNLVTCFETLEHMPDPKAGAADIAGFLDEEGVVVFSTLVQPADFAVLGMAWAYIGPRNGHVTLHSRASLAALWDPLGLTCASFNDNMHIAYRTVPAFAQHLF
jgi:hypothetical protein